MSFTGLVPSEHSTGLSEHRGKITRAGNRHLRAQLVEAAWSYQHRPHVGARIKARQQGLAPEVQPARLEQRNYDCRHGSVNSAPARTSARSSPPRSPASSPDSCGPK